MKLTETSRSAGRAGPATPHALHAVRRLAVGQGTFLLVRNVVFRAESAGGRNMRFFVSATTT